MTSEVIPCDGELTEWLYWAETSGSFRAVVVRPDTENENNFTIVGINDINTTSGMANEKTTYRVPENERFMVESGDMVAVGMLKSDNPGLHVSDNNLREIRIRFASIDSATLTSGSILSTQYVGDHEVSIAAIIRASGNCFFSQFLPKKNLCFQLCLLTMV